MGEVVKFPGQRNTIFYPSREEVEVRGKNRERWVVVSRGADGDESFHPMRTKKDVLWLTAILRKREADRRSDFARLESHPYGQIIKQLSAEDREIFRRFCDVDESLRRELGIQHDQR